MADDFNFDLDFFDMNEPYRHRSQTWGGHVAHQHHHMGHNRLQPLHMGPSSVPPQHASPGLSSHLTPIDVGVDDNMSMVSGVDGGNMGTVGMHPLTPLQTSCFDGNGAIASSGALLYGRLDSSPTMPCSSMSGVAMGSNGKKSSRRNPWGPETYADLIARAIEAHPGKKATLQQIYEFIATNYDYFKKRSDATASSGWKNSIRHNLSLHDKFVKCAKSNDNAKSCYWMVNREAAKKTYMRRRASSMDTKKAMETAKKASIARRRVANAQRSSLDPLTSLSTDAGDSLSSYIGMDYAPSSSNVGSVTLPEFTNYRQRSGSNVSTFSAISQTSHRSDSPPDSYQPSPTPLPLASSHMTPSAQPTSPMSDSEVARSHLNMDRIMEELCLEVVRRVVSDEDEGDLLICHKPYSGPCVTKATVTQYNPFMGNVQQTSISQAPVTSINRSSSPIDQHSIVYASWT